MPHIGFGELVVILVIALIVFGPGKLPSVGGAIGKAFSEFRKASKELTGEGANSSAANEPSKELTGEGANSSAANEPVPVQAAVSQETNEVKS
ncbi:Sec-independent protein translocase subunit TatA/TatB [Paenibacillus brasilensis]|uniref:Sec-independent protein translocase protein TatA n=1 Tax=Paenibacillus brasilensis TaxID=128574 RepID=A0ABU0L704_9BACL|nr:twin-arginine translocase TatA/TatE family subunit [Paenibacillus brasilensis]MDQ0497078.1 sec-independent protein translocase protein TatA [Paenibacillus brasilensis]